MKKQQEAECPKEKEANKTFKPKSEPLIPEKEKLQKLRRSRSKKLRALLTTDPMLFDTQILNMAYKALNLVGVSRN